MCTALKQSVLKTIRLKKTIDLRPFSKVSIFIEHYIKLNTNLVSLEDRQTYGAIRNESLFFVRARKKNLCANDALFRYFHKYYSRHKYNHFKEHSVGLLELNYLQRGKTIVVECTEEKPQNLETPSMH